MAGDGEQLSTEVRAFFGSDYPQDILDKVRRQQWLSRDDHVRGQRALAARGWGAPHWPVEHGGTGWSTAERLAFEKEAARAGAPTVIPMGLIYVAPVIYTFGTAEQQAGWLPDILHARSFWAQGYSEPGAGSDLAALATRAERDGDNYIVTGTKTWTSLGHWADWIFCLVRTGGGSRATDGISFLCIDMTSPGVEVRPILGLDGRHYLAQIHFDGVRVPVANRVGEEGRGWSYSKYLLANERTWYAHVAEKREALRTVRRLAGEVPSTDQPMLRSPGFATKVVQAELAVDALEMLTARARADSASGLASLIKIMATESAQAITELLLELAGNLGAPAVSREAADWSDQLSGRLAFAVPAVADYLFTRAQTIYGGTNEVQKNIIARTLLGL